MHKANIRTTQLGHHVDAVNIQRPQNVLMSDSSSIQILFKVKIVKVELKLRKCSAPFYHHEEHEYEERWHNNLIPSLQGINEIEFVDCARNSYTLVIDTTCRTIKELRDVTEQVLVDNGEFFTVVKPHPDNKSAMDLSNPDNCFKTIESAKLS